MLPPASRLARYSRGTSVCGSGGIRTVMPILLLLDDGRRSGRRERLRRLRSARELSIAAPRVTRAETCGFPRYRASTIRWQEPCHGHSRSAARAEVRTASRARAQWGTIAVVIPDHTCGPCALGMVRIASAQTAGAHGLTALKRCSRAQWHVTCTLAAPNGALGRSQSCCRAIRCTPTSLQETS